MPKSTDARRAGAPPASRAVPDRSPASPPLQTHASSPPASRGPTATGNSGKSASSHPRLTARPAAGTVGKPAGRSPATVPASARNVETTTGSPKRSKSRPDRTRRCPSAVFQERERAPAQHSGGPGKFQALPGTTIGGRTADGIIRSTSTATTLYSGHLVSASWPSPNKPFTGVSGK